MGLKTYTEDELKEILKNHRLWLEDSSKGERADLRYANLTSANLTYADLRSADLRSANLTYANLRSADLRSADLRYANLTSANLTYADLRSANLTSANLTYADLTSADLRSVDHQLTNPIDFMAAFDKTDEGYIVYKSFGENYAPPENWKIEEGSIIEEFPDSSVTVLCGAGINFGTKAWVKKRCGKPIWKCLIKWEWLPGVIVPYQTDGKARCYKLQLLEIVDKASL